jgi:hypothetical protein
MRILLWHDYLISVYYDTLTSSVVRALPDTIERTAANYRLPTLAPMSIPPTLADHYVFSGLWGGFHLTMAFRYIAGGRSLMLDDTVGLRVEAEEPEGGHNLYRSRLQGGLRWCHWGDICRTRGLTTLSVRRDAMFTRWGGDR